MGVDTYIFDEASKTCFYFDRNRNWFTYQEDPVIKAIHARMCGGYFDPTKDLERLTSAEVVAVCDVNIAYFESGEERERYRANWNKAIKTFALERPDGKFFFVNDHQEPPSWDYLKKYEGEYVEIRGDSE